MPALAEPTHYVCRHTKEEMRLVSEALYQWPDGDFPWTIMDDLSGIDRDELKSATDRGLSRWKETKRIKPRYVLNAREARLLIYAAAIDGPGGVLADCELPTPGKRQVVMRLDVGESWAADLTSLQRRIALELVIWHEGGHGLGLGHAPQGSANIMAPIYNVKQLFLGSWDLAQIVARYPREIVTGTTPTPTTPSPVPTGGGFSMGGLVSILTKLGPIVAWIMANKDKLPELMAGLKAIYEAFQAMQPQKLLLESDVLKLNLERSTLVSIIEHGLSELEFWTALTATKADDQLVAFFRQVMSTPWLLDFINNVINGRMEITPAMLSQAIKVEDRGRPRARS